MKFFGSTKKLTDKTKKAKILPILDVFEIILVQCKLVDNWYQKKSRVSYTCTPNISYAYLLNVEQSNLRFLKTYSTEFDEIIIKFIHQNSRLLINRSETLFCRTKNKKICKRI